MPYKHDHRKKLAEISKEQEQHKKGSLEYKRLELYFTQVCQMMIRIK